MRKIGIAVLFLLTAACQSAPSKQPTATPTSLSLNLPVKWTETLTPTVTTTPDKAILSPGTPQSYNTIEPLWNGMAIHPSSDDESVTVKSIWSLVRYIDLPAPGTENYTATIPPDSTWQWDWLFCATKANFPDFIRAIEIQFLLDDQALIEGVHLRMTDGSGSVGWICRRWAAVLSQWPLNQAVRLEIRWTNLTEADDGKTDYPPGEYSQLIVVIAEKRSS